MELQAGTGINDMRYYNFEGIPAGLDGLSAPRPITTRYCGVM